MTIGYTAHPSINGVQLIGVSPVDFEVLKEQGILTQRLATGNFRKTVHFAGVSLPDVKLLHSWRIDYTRLTIDGDIKHLVFVDWLSSRPGVHTFCPWQFTRVSWTVRDSQTEFFIPWRIANFFIPFPSEDPIGSRLAPVISSDPLDVAAEFDIIEKTTLDYDAGVPAAEEAWIDTEGTRFKLGRQVDPGGVVYGSFVPLFAIYMETERPRNVFTGKEGRVLVLREI